MQATKVKLIADDNNIVGMIIMEIAMFGDMADLNHIDASNVTNMKGLFHRRSFVGDISRWDVSHVVDFSNMFDESNFNGDISKWDISSA